MLYELYLCKFTTLLHVSAKLYGHHRNPYKESVTYGEASPITNSKYVAINLLYVDGQ